MMKTPVVPLFLFYGRKDEKGKNMKKKSSLLNGVSVLVVVICIIATMFKGNIQIWLYGISYVIWIIWAVINFFVPYLQTKRQEYEARCIHKTYEKNVSKASENSIFNASEIANSALQKHVNFRISSYLKSVYPDAVWEWCEKFPEQIIANGGTGRIRVFGIQDFNYAEITFNQDADINCSLLKVTPLTLTSQKGEKYNSKSTNSITIDPQVWYEKHGRIVLENLISDLNSRGYNSLVIKESGEICIRQEEKEIKKGLFENMPAKIYWDRLLKVFQGEGIAAQIVNNSIELSW